MRRNGEDAKASRLAQAKTEKKKAKANLEELTAIARRAYRGVKRPYVAHGELLYDENGLPK